MAQSKRWCVTINNYTDADLALVRTWGIYGGAQEEVGEHGTPHIQAFVVFATNQRLTALKKLHSTAHWEVMKGSIEQSEVYCSKMDSRREGTEPFVWGERPVNRQGVRTDLADAITAMRSAVGGVRTRMDAAIDAEAPTVAKYARGLEVIAQSLVRRGVTALVPPVWRPWQLDLVNTLEEAADDRHILWFTDHKGGQGKSTFIRHYVRDSTRGAIVLSGKVADMAYMFEEGTKVVFFDITRTQAENMDHLYSFAESLKNGYLVSTKYASVVKIFEPPHVVFFANVPPPPAGTKWSSDRVIHKVLGDAPTPLVF